MSLRAVHGNLFRRGQDADRNGEIVARPGLVQIGRGEVDGDAVARHHQAAVLDGGSYTLGGFFDGGIGQADEREGGQAARGVYFDLDDFAFQSDDGAGG